MIQRTLIAPLLVALFSLFTACSNEPLAEDPAATTTTEPTQKEPQVNGETPCDFNLTNLGPNDTVIIDCLLDLGGQTVNIPSGVTLEYQAGGDIINGTLNFSENDIISGEFLNASLKLSGGTPTLKETIFNFIPSRWDIVEGETTSDLALNNRNILEKVMNDTKTFGATTFEIDQMDAYFEVSKVTSTTSNQNYYPSKEAINIPSGLDLKMTNNTNLRVYPNNKEKYSLLAVDDAHDINISGGNLYGDRDKHDYSGGGTHEWGHVLALRSAVNVTVDGINISNGSGDGIDISSWGFTYQPDYKPSNNIVISNCVLDSNRRNNMSITDGYNITVQNNQFLNASIDTPHSSGIAPGWALDVEAERTRDSNGNLVYYQIAKDIKIINNIEKRSRKGAFIVFLGYDVLLEGNQTEKAIGYTFGNGIKIRNNQLTLNPQNKANTAIFGGRDGASETVYNNEISGNIITGYDVGINVENRDTEVFDNTIKEFITGIFPRNLENTNFYNNTLVSSRPDSRGIFAFQVDLNNITIDNNTINTESNPIKITRCNTSLEAVNWNINVTNNRTDSPISPILIESTFNVDLSKNSFLDNVIVYNSTNISLSDNSIETSRDGIELRSVNTNIGIINNTFNISDSNSECINIGSETDPTEVTIVDNTCNSTSP